MVEVASRMGLLRGRNVNKPPYYIKPYAVWQPRMRCWTLYDRYHRLPLVPEKCLTMEAVGNRAADMVRRYIEHPIAVGGDYIPSPCTKGGYGRFRKCPHGIIG